MDSISYFQKAASKYHDKNLKPFWLLCDLLLQSLFLEDISELLDKRKSLSVLDIGCGDGEWAERLSRISKNIRVDGVDGSSQMIELAQKRGLKNSVFMQADLNDNLWEKVINGKQYDVVISFNVGMFLEFSSSATLDLGRFLKQNGHLFYVAQNKLQIEKLLVLEGRMHQAKEIFAGKTAKVFSSYPPMRFWSSGMFEQVLGKHLKKEKLITYPNIAVNGVRGKEHNYSIADSIRENGMEDILQMERDMLVNSSPDAGMFWYFHAKNV